VPQRRDRLLLAFGARIRYLREQKSWTQEALAERADMDRSYIAAIETGLRNPSVKAAAKLARGLGVSLAELFENVM
jgi:transcriptional regulator with XRE-family HTH domain